jgi:hypothetical protein
LEVNSNAGVFTAPLRVYNLVLLSALTLVNNFAVAPLAPAEILMKVSAPEANVYAD